jgi:transposase
MGKPYSEDLRERVVGAGQDGSAIPEIADQLGVSISSVVRFRRLHRETGSVSPAKFGGHKKYALAAHEELVRQLVAEQPDITLAELKAVLATEEVTVGQSSISRFLHHLNLRFKKKPARAALRRDRVTAPFVLEGPTTDEMFKACTEQFLPPMLRRGDIVFVDNVSVHKVEGIEEAIEARGAIPFYLPAYSPDFNPIEQLFAKLKALLRKVAAYTLKNAAFTLSGLCRTVA